jgi:hypothetical protein
MKASAKQYSPRKDDGDVLGADLLLYVLGEQQDDQ